MKSRLHLVLSLSSLLTSCTRHTLTSADCREIVARIVEIQLAERGFRDPVLSLAELAKFEKLQERRLNECVGRRSRPDTMNCVRRARSAEAVAHTCLE